MANRDKISDLMKRAAPYLTRMSDDVASDTVAKEIDALVLALESHKASVDHEPYDHTWAGNNSFIKDILVNTILPLMPDTYDIGSDTYRFRKGFFSELSSLIFKKENVVIMDGQFLVTKMAGALAATALAGAGVMDFGREMIVGDFVLFRGEGKIEYVKVGSAVIIGQTLYNVSRNLDGSGANDWSEGTPFAVLGSEGEGWLELNAIDRKRFSVWAQGSDYNNSLEIGRFGDITGWQNAPYTGMGIALGDYANGKYLVYTKTDGMIVKGGTIIAGGGTVIIDDIGISIVNPSPGVGTQPFRFIDSNNDQFFSISGASILGRTEGQMILENPPEESLNSYTEFSIIAKNTLNVASFSRLDLQAFDDGNKIINTNANFIAPNIMVSQNLVVEGTIKDGDGITYLKSNAKAADADKLDGLDSTDFGRPVFLVTPLTSASWNGDSFSTTSKTLIDLSTVFGVPPGIKAVYLKVAVRDSGSAGVACLIQFSGNPVGTNYAVTVQASEVNDRYVYANAIVPCNPNGDIYYQISASGSATMDVYAEVWGYWL